MKTVEQLIFEKRFKDTEFEPNDYNDWAKENAYEAYTLCLTVAKQLQQTIMRSEGSHVYEAVRLDCKVCGKSFYEYQDLYDHYDNKHNKG